jgi:hypothetical protein
MVGDDPARFVAAFGLLVATMPAPGLIAGRRPHRAAPGRLHPLGALFHQGGGGRRAGGDFIAMVERRVGDPIVLDTADRPGRFYAWPVAVADVAQLRLADATAAAH